MRLYARVSGHVQGIGYRFFVVRTAKKSSLTGWVRNCSNGDVECEAQGKESVLKDFLVELEQGHPWARVDKIQQEPVQEMPEEKFFDIQY